MNWNDKLDRFGEWLDETPTRRKVALAIILPICWMITKWYEKRIRKFVRTQRFDRDDALNLYREFLNARKDWYDLLGRKTGKIVNIIGFKFYLMELM